MLHCSLACHCRLPVLVHAHYSGAPARASPILMEYGQPLFAWLSSD